jgi:hypothetical protein
MGQQELRRASLKLYCEATREYQAVFEELLKDASPITEDNINALEQALIEEEVRVGTGVAITLHELIPFIERDYTFVHQTGSTCMSTSLSNGMIALGESFFARETVERTHAFTQHIVRHTCGFGKPFEYRSIDDMHKYLKRNDPLSFQKHNQSLSRRYRVELTNSLIDIIFALHQGLGRVVVQQHAHANLAYEMAVLQENGSTEFFIRQRDPFTSHGSSQHRLIPLFEWREKYLWSPLKKIPSSMGCGFESLDANEVLQHLARYEEMDNLGIECISGILIPLEDLRQN